MYYNPSDRDILTKVIKENGFVKNYEVVFKTKDGTPVESLITATIRRNSDGEVIGYQGIIKDITDLKRAQNQLIRAQKMEAIGTLAGGIAHDFNNVLTTMMGYSSFLKNQVPRSEDLFKGLELIEKASIRASDLTSQLLAYTRKNTREIKPLNLNRILREVETLISRTFHKSIRIHVNTAENLPTIEGDESQIYQVIMNIAVNAQHAMPNGGKLTIETYTETIPEELEKTYFSISPGHYVCLKITDTGVGMDEETVSKIFEPYFTTRNDEGGSGLGMSVVFGIIKSHNGYIEVVSEPGRGSKIIVSFPASEKEEVEEKSSRTDINDGSGDIVVIDDEIMILQMTKDILETSGYTVRVSLSGEEGIEMTKKRIPDLVILDLRMPEMDGRHVLRQLMNIDPTMKILMSSGHVDEKQRDEILAMGAGGFIQKPFVADDLRRYVRNILNT
jgi:signal transduction histidine kinase